LSSFALTAYQGDAVQQALRPYATAGVALVGAGLIAITPMAPRLPDTFTVQDIKLVSGEDAASDLTPWTDVFNTASANATTLTNTFFEAPAVGLQQGLADLSGYAQDLLDDPANSNTVAQQMQVQLAALLTGPSLQGASTDTTSTVLDHTLEGNASDFLTTHLGAFGILPEFIPPSIPAADITPLLNFIASPDSGILMGALGPEISPFVELFNCITAGDDFNTTLADVTGAFFNGADLNLDSLIPAIEQAGILPPGYNLENLDIAFGGLLTPGDTEAGVGGSIFNSVGVTLTGINFGGTPSTLDLASEPVGPIGAWEGLDQTIAALLGWTGSGSPLADVTLPTIPTDFLDSGTAAATTAADLSTWVQDLLAAF
jgi:hypothetical protein